MICWEFSEIAYAEHIWPFDQNITALLQFWQMSRYEILLHLS